MISLVQSIGIAIGLEGMQNGMFVQSPGWSFRLMTVLTLTTGTIFVMWLGEQINERGIGNGISVIIFAGIIANIPQAAINTIRLYSAGQVGTFLLIIVGIMILLVTTAVVYIESAKGRYLFNMPRELSGERCMEARALIYH